MLALAATSLLVAAWSPAALPVLRPRSPRLAVANQAVMSEARTMPSGLVYEEITAGTGDSPKLEQTVKVHYTGSLSDGSVFDSSFSRGAPTEFKLNSVIQGWQEGLQLMKVGGKARLTIPASLGYGAKQMNTIPPNSELTFEVELLGAKSEAMLPDNYLGRSFGAGSTLEAPPSPERRSSPPPASWGWARLAPGGAPHSGGAIRPPRAQAEAEAQAPAPRPTSLLRVLRLATTPVPRQAPQ
jgi:FKBP-type peptidyl-prolyl cis-trans isomerase FkpA